MSENEEYTQVKTEQLNQLIEQNRLLSEQNSILKTDLGTIVQGFSSIAAVFGDKAPSIGSIMGLLNNKDKLMQHMGPAMEALAKYQHI